MSDNSDTKNSLNLTPLSSIQANNIMNYVQPDTLWGDLGLRTRSTNNDPLSDVDLTVTSVTIPPHNVDLEYNFVSDNMGMVNTSLPTYIDTVTDIQYFQLQKPKVFPTVGSDLNIFFSNNNNNNEKKSINVYSVLGQIVINKDFSKDEIHLNLEELAAGPYVYTVSNSSNIITSGKYIKTNTASQGPAQRPSRNNQEDVFKNTTFQDYATYKVKWEKGGWLTDSTNIDVYTGENGNFFFYLERPEPITATQDIAGFVQNGNSDTPLERIADAAVVLEHLNTGDFYLEYTQADGTFIFNDMPVQMHYLDPKQEFLFHVGGIENKYAFKNVEYSTPLHNENTWTASDTINDNFNVVLMDKVLTTSAEHIGDQDRHGTRRSSQLLELCLSRQRYLDPPWEYC